MPNKSVKGFDVRANPHKPLGAKGLPTLDKGGPVGAPNTGTPGWLTRPAKAAAKKAK